MFKDSLFHRRTLLTFPNTHKALPVSHTHDYSGYLSFYVNVGRFLEGISRNWSEFMGFESFIAFPYNIV